MSNVPVKIEPELKCWGTATHVWASPESAVSYLEVLAGFRCSRHRHIDRHNMFAMISGVICVETWRWGLSQPVDYEFLEAGQVLTVEPRVWHRFRVLHAGRLVEVYHPKKGKQVRHEDIERVDKGGVDDIEELKQMWADRRLGVR